MPGNITFNSIVEAEEISTGNTEAVKEDKSKVLPEVKNYSLKQSNINILSGKSGVRKQWAGVKRTVLKAGLQSETRR